MAGRPALSVSISNPPAVDLSPSSVRDRPPTPPAHRSVRRVVKATSIALAENPRSPTASIEGAEGSNIWVRSASTKLMRSWRLRRSTKRAKSVDNGRAARGSTSGPRSPSPSLWKRMSFRMSQRRSHRQHDHVSANTSLTLESEPGNVESTVSSPRRIGRFDSWRKNLSLRRSKSPMVHVPPPTPPAGTRVRFQRTSSCD